MQIESPGRVHDELPVEILHPILRLATADLASGLRSYKSDGIAQWESYDKILQHCTQYRLVDSTWNAVVTRGQQLSQNSP